MPEDMLTVVGTFIAAIGAGWMSWGGQLLASGITLLCGHQDLGLRARIGAAFWFLMALAFAISALVTAIYAKSWGGVAICTVVLFVEAWLILGWRRRRAS